MVILRSMLTLPAAILLMLGGTVSCFAGYRLFRVVLAIYGFILGAMLAPDRSLATLPISIIMPALTLIGCAYEVLALLYWFRAPAIGVAVGTGCFAAAWLLSLR